MLSQYFKGKVMDFYIKLFFVNWVLLFFVAGMDIHIFSERIGARIPKLLGAWAIFSLCSIPAIMIYWIMS